MQNLLQGSALIQMQNKTAKRQNFMHGAVILTIGVVIMKILGAFYKIPLGNILKDDGYSMFTSAYNVYYVFFTLATAGMPVALSRLIAEADANGRAAQEEKTFRVALCTFAVIGILFSSVMFLFPEWLATSITRNPDAAWSIRAMAPSILLVCLVSAYRGYCQGNGNMIPTTVDEVLEVLFKVLSGVLLSSLIMRAGLGKPLGSAGALFGATVGSIVSLTYMIIYKKRNYRSLAASYSAGIHAPCDTPDDDNVVDSTSTIVKDVLRIGIPISLGASIMAILNLVDSSLCMGRLQSAAGFSYSEAKVLYGIYGKAQTLFNLPAALTQPLNISSVPAIAGAIAAGRRTESGKITEDSLRITSVISLPMGVGLTVMAFPIINLLYPNSHQAGPLLLRIMGVCSFFVCIVLMQNAILQASGKERLPMYSMITGSLVKITVNWFLVATPSINIVGAPIGTLCGYVTMMLMNFIFMRKSAGLNIRYGRVIFKPLLCSVIMGVSALLVYVLAGNLIGTASWMRLAICTVLAIFAAVVVYVITVVVFKTVTNEDLQLIPGGAKIGKLLHIR